MRVTSKMMTTNMLSNINRNKNNMSSAADQYATQQKIQRPSEDPVIAVRSLKYRTSLRELSQYHDKNVPDAMSWMEQTESALDNINEILTQMNTYFNQGANDTLESSDRDALIQTLREYKNQIYDCMNADNAGRYVFTGYRTDIPLLFDANSTNLKYTINEPITFDDVQTTKLVISDLTYNGTTSAEDYANAAAKEVTIYRTKLTYNNIDKFPEKLNFGGTDVTVTTISQKDLDKNLADYNTETPETDKKPKALFVKETGELILNNEAYKAFPRTGSVDISYEKSNFQKDEIRPEHYFDCTVEDLSNPSAGAKSYQKPTSQHIKYEINFSQSITVNTMANECIDGKLGNLIDDIVNQLNKVMKVEEKLKEAETIIQNRTYPANNEAGILEYKKQLENELALEKSVLQQKFGNGITVTSQVQANVNKAVADLGSRYKRLELTEARLSDQISSYTEMLAKNDTVEMEDAIINYTSAMTTYNASLNAAAKVVQNSLLDFL